MSIYHKAKVVEFINANKHFLIELDKCKHLRINSSTDDFINALKIRSKDMRHKYAYLDKNKKHLIYKEGELQLINASSTFKDISDDEIKNIIETTKNELTRTEIINTKQQNQFDRTKLYDLYQTKKIYYRKGTMSFSLCNQKKLSDLYLSMCQECKNDTCVIKNDCNKNIVADDTAATVSLNPRYYDIENPKNFGRITYYKNNKTLHIYDFSSNNYKNRYVFRKFITELILGPDSTDKIINNNLSVQIGFFRDDTIGQEIYYYFLEIYNYDRYNRLLNSYNSFSSTFNKSSFNEFCNDEMIITMYPPFDGVLYFDHSTYKNVNYPGTECLLFNNELNVTLYGILFVFNNKFYNANSVKTSLDDFLNYIKNPIINPDNEFVLKNICSNFK